MHVETVCVFPLSCFFLWVVKGREREGKKIHTVYSRKSDDLLGSLKSMKSCDKF